VSEEAAFASAEPMRRWPSPAVIQSFGDLLQRRQDVIRRIQWLFVALYATLLIGPVVLPSLAANQALIEQLTRSAQFVFWGLWWPGVLLGTMLFGQFWCGILCPDGALTEFASRHGRHGKIPAWLRRGGWPLLAFTLITLLEHLIDAHRYAATTLLTVGGTTALAIVCGLLLGKGKRVWCRYLCPVGGVFSLLARCAVFHFKVDRAVWDAALRPLPKPIDCPPLLDVRRLRSNEKCSMCGRCSGHRDAVKLALRKPGDEISTMPAQEARIGDAMGIMLVLIGLTFGLVHWRGSWPHRVLTQSLQEHALAAASGIDAWRWLLRVPIGQGATGADAIAGLGAILLLALLVTAVLAALLVAVAGGRMQRAGQLAYSLIPLAGFGLVGAALAHASSILGVVGPGDWPGASLLHLLLGIGAVWSWQLGTAIRARA
jgi:polyferredoxin